MLDHARVVIIGGGIVGCSIAYHLVKLDCSDVVLLEKGSLTGGSTWHAAGLVGQLRSHRNVTRMLQYSVELYEKLEAETGLATGWKNSGCLHLACTEDRLREIKRGATTAKSFGLEMNLISPGEARDLFPILNTNGIIGAAFMPSDGQADPSGLTLAMAKGARNGGAKIYEETLVSGFRLRNERVVAVDTAKGQIGCEFVVNAAGMWGREIGRMMGVNIPLVPFQHQFLVTDPIEGIPSDLPTLRDKDNLLYYKEEVGGLVIGGYEHDGIPWAVKGIPKGFSQELLEPDFDHFQPLLEAAMQRTPCLETAGVSRLVNGPEAFTPDGNCILGPAPELENCYVAVGFNAFGIAAGGGAGRMLAEWMIEGEPSFDLWPLDIRRFGPHHQSPQYNLERTKEIYGKHYAISWPHEEHGSARGIRRSPLYDLLRAQGAVYGAKNGWERPNWFAPHGVAPRDELTYDLPNWFAHVGNEHRAVRERVGLIDQTSFNKFAVSGSGALAALNRLAANNIDQEPGRVVYTQLCNARGGVECDLTITRLKENRFLIVTGTAFGAHDAAWIKKHLPKDGSVVFQDVTSSYAMINVCGPSARKLLENLTEEDIGNRSFPLGHCRQLTLGCAPAVALRMTYVGELGYELYIPSEYAGYVYQMLREAGQPLGVSNVGYRAVESLRLEKGYRYWSKELTPDYTPYDAGLGFCVDLQKRDFIGRQALAEVKQTGPRWKLCCFTLQTDEPILLLGGETICHQGEALGVVTSGGYGYSARKTIAYGFLAAEQADHASGYAVEAYGEMLPAAPHRRPLYDPERKKITC